MSPAAYAVMTSSQDSCCPYCSHPIGSWEHMALHCAHFAEVRPRQKANNPLVARFGCPLQLDDIGSTNLTLNYLAKVAAVVVTDRRGHVKYSEAARTKGRDFSSKAPALGSVKQGHYISCTYNI